MARSAPTSQQPATDLRPYKTLFQHFLPRYLNHPEISAFLMDDNQPPLPPDASNLASSLSYACMYYPPTSLPRSCSAPYPMPQPFLDFGDFMLCDNVYDGIAVGHLYNYKDEHPLALLRDKVLRGNQLSKVPKARKFAADLSMTNLEVIEFAWLADHSLIIACRRLDHTKGTTLENQLVLSGDLLFYDVIPRGLAPDIPLLRMTFAEKPAICQFCGTRGIKTCACPASFKTRAPSPSAVPLPYSHSAFPDSQDINLQLVPPGPLAGRLATWDCYARRIFNVSTAGSFFVNWYKRTPGSSSMKLFMSPENPISYQFVCGTRKQTLALAAMYVKRISLCERACKYDARLYGANSATQDVQMNFDRTDEPKDDNSWLGTNGKNSSDFFQVQENPPKTTSYPLTTPSPLADDLYAPSAHSSSSGVSIGNIDGLSNDYSEVLDDVQHDLVEPMQGPLPPGAEGIRQLDCDRTVPSLSQPIHTSAPFEADSQIAATRTSLYSDILFDDIARLPPQNDFNMIDSEQSNTATEQTAENRKPALPRDRGPRLTLSTTSREIQQYMTVDASNTPTCKQCGSSFPKRGNLARHIQTVHLKLKPFQCKHCKASFGYKNHLKRHQIVHQRGNEFKCRICSRDFKGRLQLSKHMQQVHEQNNGECRAAEDTDKARVNCDICGATFSQKSNLSRHMLIHEGLRFVCPVCPELCSFGQRYDLYRHIMRKHPEFPESCIMSITPQKIDRPSKGLASSNAG